MANDSAIYQVWLYASEAQLRPGAEAQDLDEIVQSSRKKNGKHGITGALLYAGGRFCQMVEGPIEAVGQI